MYLSFKTVRNKEHKGEIGNMTSSSNSSQSTCPVVIQDECIGKIYSSFPDFTDGADNCFYGKLNRDGGHNWC